MDNPNFSLWNRFEVKRDSLMREAETARLINAGKSGGGTDVPGDGNRLAPLAFAVVTLLLLALGIALYLMAYSPIEFALQ